MKRAFLAFGLLVALSLSLVFLDAFGTFGDHWGCTDDGLGAPEPDGWQFQRDGYNGCEWTLFNDEGERAPGDLYDGTGVAYPGSPLFSKQRLLALAVAVGSLVGLIRLVKRGREDR